MYLKRGSTHSYLDDIGERYVTERPENKSARGRLNVEQWV